MQWLLKNQSTFDVLLEISSFIEANLLWSMSNKLFVFAILMFLLCSFALAGLQRMHLASSVQVPSEDGSVDDTGVEEAIVPTDMNLLTGEAISPSHFW